MEHMGSSVTGHSGTATVLAGRDSEAAALRFARIHR